MAFDWTEDISVNASIDADDINEVKTNIDTVYTYRSITRTGCGSGAGWSELPVSVGGPIESADMQELRDAADYAEDNICGTNFNGEHLTENQTNNVSVFTTHVGAEDNGDESTDRSSEHTAYLTSNLNQHYINVNSPYCGSANSGPYCMEEQSSICAQENSTYYYTVESSD